ncbi:MAG: hypothetical protein C4575_01680 [Desulforudis sp.]|nr:MAG: hypothetical protein C4575_01680 [Desulforudis sp.]
MPLSSDLRVLKKNDHQPEGQVVLSLKDTLAELGVESPEIIAQKVIAEARAEVEAIREIAHREGFEKGYREGEQAARNLQAEAEKVRDQARLVLAQAEQIRSETLAKMEPEILQLAVGIAERLMEQQLSAPDTIRSIVRTAVEAARDREYVVVFVNPNEVGVVQDHAEEFLKSLTPGASIRVISDEEITAGGCYIETEGVLVDATLETRWALLLEALRKDGR